MCGLLCGPCSCPGTSHFQHPKRSVTPIAVATATATTLMLDLARSLEEHPLLFVPLVFVTFASIRTIWAPIAGVMDTADFHHFPSTHVLCVSLFHGPAANYQGVVISWVLAAHLQPMAAPGATYKVLLGTCQCITHIRRQCSTTGGTHLLDNAWHGTPGWSRHCTAEHHCQPPSWFTSLADAAGRDRRLT